MTVLPFLSSGQEKFRNIISVYQTVGRHAPESRNLCAAICAWACIIHFDLFQSLTLLKGHLAKCHIERNISGICIMRAHNAYVLNCIQYLHKNHRRRRVQ
jgi:hypothetical protein